VVLCDEIYDHILYDDANSCPWDNGARHPVLTMSGLSKVYLRAAIASVGHRSPEMSRVRAEYLSGLELLSS